VWHDAKFLADRIAAQQKYLAYETPTKRKKKVA